VLLVWFIAVLCALIVWFIRSAIQASDDNIDHPWDWDWWDAFFGIMLFILATAVGVILACPHSAARLVIFGKRSASLTENKGLSGLQYLTPTDLQTSTPQAVTPPGASRNVPPSQLFREERVVVKVAATETTAHIPKAVSPVPNTQWQTPEEMQQSAPKFFQWDDFSPIPEKQFRRTNRQHPSIASDDPFSPVYAQGLSMQKL
jgi:hypothetical protein